MDFIAIDFETANEKRSSPCALGITVIKNNKIIEEKYWLIKPKELRFEPINIWIHGIKEKDVIDSKEFNELWNEILPYFENNYVFAHNASFDISVLRNTLDLYGIEYPKFKYCCTMLMSKNFFDYLDNSKLNTVSNHLGFKLNHHNASSDASGCANIMLKIQEELHLENIDDILSAVGVSFGIVFPDGYTPCRNIGKKIISNRKSNFNICHDELYISPTSFFNGKVVVFTGPLSSMTRAKASVIIKSLGGSVGSSVTKKTNILITGIKNIQSLSIDEMSTKLRKAIDLDSKGQDITFLNEEEFLDILE